MIEQPLKRGEKCYWKQGDNYATAYFYSLNAMPIAPHAVKIKYRGLEHMVKDFEVFTVESKFREIHSKILYELSVTKNKAAVARDLKVPYSRVLNVNNQAKELGIIHAKKAT